MSFLYGNFIKDEYTHSLRLESELSDLRSGYANPATTSQGEIPRTGHQKEKEKAGRLSCFPFGDSYGNRTHVFSVRGWCLNRLTNGPFKRWYYITPFPKKQEVFEKKTKKPKKFLFLQKASVTVLCFLSDMRAVTRRNTYGKTLQNGVHRGIPLRARPRRSAFAYCKGARRQGEAFCRWSRFRA